jgi:DNA-binding beta-propeller fold protein YncE
MRYAGTVNAPDFPPGAEWVGGGPLALADLRGKLVVLDFWTSGCVNCHHMLPRLRRLGRKYARELVVIGVHAGKFPHERAAAAVAHAARRLNVGHPVVNDPDHRLRDAYAVRSWPTLMFIDPRGKVFGTHEGEATYDALDAAVASMIAQFDARGLIDRKPAVSVGASARRSDPDTVGLTPRRSPGELLYPGKLLADPAGGRLFVADTGHHRVLELDIATGATRAAYGSGEPGFVGGPAGRARFDGPRGLALHGDSLYVADTNNHAVRRIDLASGRVGTVAGGPDGPVRSPWDVAVSRMGRRVWVAGAGTHQLWEIDPAGEDPPAVWAGTGVEDIRDGPREGARFAQPSGLALDEAGGRLFVADSEASGIRVVDLRAGGRVTTLAGRDLFEYGDRDGTGVEVVRLQHPLGVAWDDGYGVLYVADTFNHKVKAIDPATGRVWTVAGAGEAGFRDGTTKEVMFNEPGGLAAVDGRVYVADTNNHAIRVVDVTGEEVTTLPGIGKGVGD